MMHSHMGGESNGGEGLIVYIYWSRRRSESLFAAPPTCVSPSPWRAYLRAAHAASPPPFTCTRTQHASCVRLLLHVWILYSSPLICMRLILTPRAPPYPSRIYHQLYTMVGLTCKLVFLEECFVFHCNCMIQYYSPSPFGPRGFGFVTSKD